MICKIICCNMTSNVMNRDQRLIQCKCSSFCKIHAYKNCPNKTGSEGYSNCIDLGSGKSGIIQRLISQPINCLYMLPGSKFWYYTAIYAVERNLRGNAIC